MPDNLETQVALLSREIISHNDILKTLSGAIQEMGKVTNAIERMLVLHDQRIVTADKGIETIREDLREHQVEVQAEVAKLYTHIEKKNDNLASMITTCERSISGSIQTLTSSIQERDKIVDARLSVLEKRWYVILGAGVVSGFILNIFVSNLSALTSLITK